jgi:nitrous oxidase accessory protein
MWRALAVLLLSLWAVGAQAAPPQGAIPLQPLIDETPVGGTLTLPPGVYSGPAVINKMMVLDGGGQAVLDNGGHGTLLVIKADGVTVADMTFRNSGALHDDLDAAIHVRSRYNVIKNNRIENCLFGVDLKQAHNNVVRGNRIRSQLEGLGLRGDAIRLWYSNDNVVRDNDIDDSRDMVVWYSKDNKLTGNTVKHGRYGLHFMYSHVNLVENNRFVENTVGVFMMFSSDITLRSNRIERSNGPSGIGVGFKEASGVTLENNDILGNATGFYLDTSPNDPDTENVFDGNRVAFNGVAALFHSDWPGNIFRRNDFIGNFTQVSVRGGGGATKNRWNGNHWDAYEGFDVNKDGTGDTPFESHVYADRLWMDVPATQFFRASPVLELLDFIERLAPFTPPRLLLRDEKPAVRRLTAH